MGVVLFHSPAVVTDTILERAVNADEVPHSHKTGAMNPNLG